MQLALASGAVSADGHGIYQILSRLFMVMPLPFWEKIEDLCAKMVRAFYSTLV
jgi:hypothetical protein